MNLTDDYTLKFQCGVPIFLDDICAIYPATLRQIIEIGYTTFQQYLNIILVEKPTEFKEEDKDLKELLKQLTDFQYLLMMVTVDMQANQILKDSFRFFTHENIVISLDPAQIIIGPIEEKHLLTEEKFYEFRQILKRMYFIEQEGEEIIIYENDSPSVRRLKEQMRLNREKVKRAKAKQFERDKTGLKFSDLIGSITINNCGLNMENIWNITYYAFHDQLKRMGWRDQFNINNQAAMAGAKLKKNQLKHWMRSIASSDKS